MFTCRLCGFEVEADDTVVIHGARCICLRCYLRETGDRHTMTPELRRWIEQVLALLA